MHNSRSISNISDLIEVVINLDNKLYKRAIEKRYNQLRERAEIFFEPTIKYQQKESRSNQKYSNPDYCKSASIELDFTQQRKKKNSREKQDNKFQKTCYLCDKPGHFARDCRLRNLVDRRQINAILREIPDSQNNIRKQIDTETEISETESDNNYYLIENSDQLQKVLDRILSDKIFASMQKIN